MEIEKDFDYPSRKQENESLDRLYNFMDNNYPYIAGNMCGMRLTDFSYRKRVDYNETASMNPLDNMNLGKFKDELNHKVETVHREIENLDNLNKSLNSVINSKITPYKLTEDKVIKEFHHLPKTDDIEFQNTPLMQADALKMTDETMMKKNWKFQERAEKGEVDTNDPYSAFKKNEEDDYETNKKKMISSLHMSSSVAMDIDEEEEEEEPIQKSATKPSSTHIPIITHVPFQTTKLFNERNKLRQEEVDKELQEFIQRPKKVKKPRTLVPIPLNEEERVVQPNEEENVVHPKKKKNVVNDNILSESIELEQESARYSKYHSDQLRKRIDEQEAHVRSKAKKVRTVHEANTLDSEVQDAAEIEIEQRNFINQRNLLKVPKKKVTYVENIDDNEDVIKMRNVLYDNIYNIEEKHDEIPDSQQDIKGLQTKVKEYVLFYRNHLSSVVYKDHRIDEHGTRIFNFILKLFKEPLLDGNEKLVDAFKTIKPFLSKKKSFV